MKENYFEKEIDKLQNRLHDLKLKHMRIRVELHSNNRYDFDHYKFLKIELQKIECDMKLINIELEKLNESLAKVKSNNQHQIF